MGGPSRSCLFLGVEFAEVVGYAEDDSSAVGIVPDIFGVIGRYIAVVITGLVKQVIAPDRKQEASIGLLDSEGKRCVRTIVIVGLPVRIAV